MIRLFAALAIPEEIGVALQARQTGLDGVRWSPLENLHVTLRFFGELREDVARDLDSLLISLPLRPFELVLEGAGAFQDGLDVHAVWAGVAENPELLRLQKSIETAARRIGLKADTRQYKPHVTLAYLNRPDPAEVRAWIQANNLLKSPAIRVERFGLYSSHLGKAGARYSLEAEYP